MMKISPRERLIGAATLFLAFVYVIFFVLLKPIKGMVSDIDENIATSQERLEKGRALLEGNQELQKTMDQMVQEWGRGSSDAAESSELVNMLEAAATKSAIRILNIEPRPIVKDVIVRYPIAVNISGTTKDIAKFLYLIQKKPLSLSVDNLNLERTADGNAVISGSMTVSRLHIASP